MRVRTHSKRLMAYTGILAHKTRQHGGTARPTGLLLALTNGRITPSGHPRGLLLLLTHP